MGKVLAAHQAHDIRRRVAGSALCQSQRVSAKMRQWRRRKKNKREKGENEISPKLVAVKKEDDDEVIDKSWKDYYRAAELSPTEPPDDDAENDRLNQEIQAALQDSVLFC